MVLVAQPCLTLCNPLDCSPPGSSVYEILQAGILKWVLYNNQCASHTGVTGSIPGQGTKTPHTSRCSKKKKKYSIVLLITTWKYLFTKLPIHPTLSPVPKLGQTLEQTWLCFSRVPLANSAVTLHGQDKTCLNCAHHLCHIQTPASHPDLPSTSY